MVEAEHEPGPIRILSPTTEDEWRQTDVLMTELKEWDVQQSQVLGFDRCEVLSVFYPDASEDVRRNSVPPEGGLLLAIAADFAAGCAAFRRLTPNSCEVYNVYVRPVCRGQGIGSMLLQKLKREAAHAGYDTMCLETATFMHDAHKLYRSLGFQVRAPYRTLEDRFAKATMWLECGLDNPPTNASPRA
jgi:ribosomal protein S18 acetylase RimI-like enzyme